jgi:D-3-phosphoglycerate dehydrogenase
MKVLVTDMRHASVEEERRVLEPAGLEVDTTFSETEEQLIRNGRGAVGFLVSYARITRRVMEALPELKIIVKYGIGVDNIDAKAAADLGKVVANVPEYCVEEVALHAATLALVGLRRLCVFAGAMKSGHWIGDPNQQGLRRPSTLTAGTLGFGRIARRFAAYMKAVTGQIIYYDPYVPQAGPDYAYCRPAVSPADLFQSCQILSIHAPLNAETRDMVGPELLARAKDLILVNTSRAGIVQFEALGQALNEGRVEFYGADVFWQEPADFSDPGTLEFLRRPDVLITPHMSWCSLDSERDVRRQAAEEILRVVRGESPLNPVSS